MNKLQSTMLRINRQNRLATQPVVEIQEQQIVVEEPVLSFETLYEKDVEEETKQVCECSAEFVETSIPKRKGLSFKEMAQLALLQKKLQSYQG